jgi:hypothetical protein
LRTAATSAKLIFVAHADVRAGQTSLLQGDNSKPINVTLKVAIKLLHKSNYKSPRALRKVKLNIIALSAFGERAKS